MVALLISTEKVARVFFDARYYVLKSRTFALVDSDGKHMDVKNTFELNKALVIFYIVDMSSLVFLCKRSKINKVNYTLKEVLYGKELIH